MNDESTGSETTTTISRRTVPSVVTSGTVSGDAYTPTLATSGTRSTGANELPITRGKRFVSQSRKVLPKVKHACYGLFTACMDNLDRALDHESEFFLRNNSLEQLKDTLNELWNLRSQREEQYAEMLNMLQGIFAERNVEHFTTDNLGCLRSVFGKLREALFYSDSFANEITLELLNGGIDAFREIE